VRRLTGGGSSVTSWIHAGLVATSALAIWKAMMLVTLCESPVRDAEMRKAEPRRPEPSQLTYAGIDWR